ncbi:MAG: hypothetical protein NT144_10145 [Bacteroidia bacterium]|nr:hypothetical protein [Bacteroidia bacterium]
MKIKALILSIISLTVNLSTIFSQFVTQPNYALKSHETLEISKVELTEENTVVFLTVENRINGGNFCADKNIFIIYPDGTRSKLTSSRSIPVCPETYKFKTLGEKLDFVLKFPPLNKGTEWIDLIEDCSENCFSFYGITLDDNLNKKIDDAFGLVENNEPAKALAGFINIAEETDNKNLGIEGLVYINIIKLARETGNTAKAAEWYNRLKSSGSPRFELYIKHLNTQGINY